MSPYSNRVSIGRKPQATRPQATDGKRFAPGTRVQQESVKAQITDLFAGRDCRNYAEVIAKRLGIPVASVSHIMAGLVLEWERRAKSLEVTCLNAKPMADEAGRAVWEDA